MKKNVKQYLQRFRNPILISSILSFIFILLNQLEIINLPSSKVEFIINSVLSILILLGLVNNPENKKVTSFKESYISNQEIEEAKLNFEDQEDWS